MFNLEIVKVMFIASIVTYNPEIPRLKQNIDSIICQVNEIVVVDNGSFDLKDIEILLSCYDKIHIIKMGDNKGIAFALNQAAAYACSKGYKWIITLDQDSVAPENLVSTYKQFVSNSDVGMVGCKIVDRNYGETNDQKNLKHGYKEVPMLITSASMLNLNVWKEVGGFCDEMFIDSVDFDICLSIREHGYKIIRTYETALLHEVGHSEIRHSFGKDRQIYHHNPIRYYYMVRNGIFLGKRHHFVIKATYRVFRMAFFTLLYDDRRIQKAKMMLKGLYHAIINRYGEYK